MRKTARWESECKCNIITYCWLTWCTKCSENRFSWEINKYSKIVRWKITSVHAGMGDTAYEKQREREGGKESRVTWGSEGDYSMWRQHHRGNRARGMKEIKVWPTERVAASQWGQTLLAAALLGATTCTCAAYSLLQVWQSQKSSSRVGWKMN